ncbi:MAG: hypothetical protein ACON3Z_04470 [Bradymonadia bacterium]
MSDDPKKLPSQQPDSEQSGDILTSSSLLNFAEENFAAGEDDDFIVSAGLPQERVTFSDLSALVPERKQATLDSRPTVSAITSPSASEIHSANQSGLGRLTMVLLAIALVGGGVAFWYHSTGPSAGTSAEAPANANSALDVPSAVKTPPAPSVGQLEGRLKLDPIQITLPKGASKAPVILSSRVSNQSNRLQHSITLRVTLSTEDGLAVASRKYPCCSDETADPVEVEKVRLKPGASVDYKIKMPVPKLPSAKLKATAELLFAETEIVP